MTASAVETMADGGAGHSHADREVLERGDAVGRYVVVSRLGAGAMGVVYAAYDPELDRKVALKLLRDDPGGASGSGMSDGRARLVREAQALAKLSHPNVVAVHDVGTHARGVWLAMEYVDGETLKAWSSARQRSWQEVVRVCIDVGHGVAAAHAAGILHRDLKPDNIMVAKGGRVRVMDFGLAKSDVSASAVTDTPVEAAASMRAPAEGVTQAGAMLGTPLYMAPEQFTGISVGPPADQFALCVTLWEALYGARPFAGATIAELITNVMDGRPKPPPRGREVPAWIHPICLRGLAPAPEDRFPTIDALIAALERGQGRARRRTAAVATAVAGALAAGVFGWVRHDERTRIAACEAAGATIDDVWNDDVRTNVSAALLATGVAHAETTAAKVSPWLDAHAAAWRQARTDACLDAEVREASTADTYARALWCLDERQMGFAALVDELVHADARAVDKAVTAATRLSSMDACADADLLGRLPLPLPESREEIRTVRLAMSRAAAASAAGNLEEAREVSSEARRACDALSWPPLTAAVAFQLGDLHRRAGDYAAAETTLEEAYFLAANAGALDIAAGAADGLAYLVGAKVARPADGLRWSKHAETALTRLGEHDAGFRTESHFAALANIRGAMGEYADAKTMHEQVLALQRQRLGEAHPELATTLIALANVQTQLGEYEDARTALQRALTMTEDALGANHPDVARALTNLANVYSGTGDHAQATALHERALAIREAALGPRHPDLAKSLNNLAVIRLNAGESAEAKALYSRALSILEDAVGPAHPDVAGLLMNLALVHDQMGELAEAKALHVRALAILEKALGDSHPDVAMGLNNLASVHQDLGELAQAYALYQRALGILEAALGPSHPLVQTNHLNLGSLHRALGDHAAAKASYERARTIGEAAKDADPAPLAAALFELADLALVERRAEDAVALGEQGMSISERSNVSAEGLAFGRFVLARALWDTGGDAARARELATQARDGREVGSKQRVEIERWLTEHGASQRSK